MNTNRINILVSISVAILTFLAWSYFNQPNQEPDWPEVIQGFAFAPYRQDQDPKKGIFPSTEQIDEDLALLAWDTESIRTYTTESTLGEIPRLAEKYQLKVTLGAWIDTRRKRNLEELVRVIDIANKYTDTIDRVIVGNEVLLRGQVPIDELITYLERVRSQIPTPVSVAETWDIWLDHPELVSRVDFITVHLLPYWEHQSVEKAVEYAARRYREVAAAYPNKPILIGEVGWPSNGRQRGAAVATPANQAQFLRRFISLAESEGWDYFIIEAFDQPHKSADEGAVGAYWGVYDVNREAKFSFHKPIVSIPQWRTLAAISVFFAILTLVILFSDSHALNSLGRSFLAIISFSVATGMVWLIYEYTRQYMTWATLLLGLVMLVAIFGLILVLLVEAHEWAEALWLSKLRRPFVHHETPDKDLPFVSIHVPAYNEPPEMLNETLSALARMDYPHFEVLVIDNNTKDPEVWQPVEKHCAKLGERFRFFHVNPLDGFKAGALNYALEQTAEKAEVIAVIDSDYLVEPSWLRELTPSFRNPKIAIVQAPQDYRDGAENAFKAMCMAEYRGFFNIGMVTRNERNAIIQHGTMTMVRRSVLEEVGRWSDWCITEDAELGLRVFEKGYEALYIPRSYGRGLIPDTFMDFKKQRFRWAYGAVLTMRHHFKELLGTKKTGLSRGQRFHFVAGWLPWVSDGLSLVFNMAALFWTVGMLLFAEYIDPPLVIFAIFPLAMFAFKILKLGFLYRWRVNAGIRQSIAAAIAGLALSHTISRAMMTGIFNKSIGFFRTPKRAAHSAFLQALSHAREELLIMTALWLGAFAVVTIPRVHFGLTLETLQSGAFAIVTIPSEGAEIDTRMWAIMLLVQSIPYAAAVVMSLVSALPRLPARLIGSMGELEDEEESVYRADTKAPVISDQPPREP